MEVIERIFGVGKDLTEFQMVSRTIVVFVIAFLLIRISGRRSFGLHTPLDNIITIMLGAVLSRAIVGASPFLPVIASSAVLVVAHRFFAHLLIHNERMANLAAGKKHILFEKGSFINQNMDKALVGQEDIMEEVRRKALTEDLEKVERIYMERNGEINSVKK
jgi:uncharacterized membrane protein YcaP (DUF421 family)